MFNLQEFKFRKKFWSPWEQYKERIGQEFNILSVFDKEDPAEDENGELIPIPMFRIKFKDGLEIDAWEEEVVCPTTILVNDEHPPSDDEL